MELAGSLRSRAKRERLDDFFPGKLPDSDLDCLEQKRNGRAPQDGHPASAHEREGNDLKNSLMDQTRRKSYLAHAEPPPAELSETFRLIFLYPAFIFKKAEQISSS